MSYLMEEQLSCGAVLFRQKDTQRDFFLVQQKNKQWGFPRGRNEEGENYEQTALREIFEETGYHCTIINGFQEEISFIMYPKKRKIIIYFLAEAQGEQVGIP